ncbi:MAG: hypothetical protein KVP17_001722 [Porospora cf. gigantea B]|uniref:uncharacterized protein n=1 Tax=Porospora cf. gigantea B TaxID=2853592 RepID=UPI003571D7D3|nr:MAG: hypothetical protein KVP17_001722 [Porospora cf. gigantea B]
MTVQAQAKFTDFQDARRKQMPTVPTILQSPVKFVEKVTSQLQGDDAAILTSLFPNTGNKPFLACEKGEDGSWSRQGRPMKMGVLLSGGQAPGGHNVIAGIFDHLKRVHPDSELYGFKCGPHGLFTKNCTKIVDDNMDLFRNMGGFDMICSGRHKIESEEHKMASLEVCRDLGLDGLVIIGGDDSNTNAAILGEYFAAHDCATVVVGCPKTIDGDLKNEFVEASFGFDTACKVFSEYIGYLCRDILGCQDRYHFVRLMGRSASNITLECAMQTRPNLTFIGEEVLAGNRSLKSLVDEIVDLVKLRHSQKKDYGVILVPEGLIEFIPEIGNLIKEINEILAKGEFSTTALSAAAKSLFESLPMSIGQQLLLDRDPHGNVQVSKIATEELLIEMVEKELTADIPFIPVAHFFGYEGRCAMPSEFDSNYCYALGLTAGELVMEKKNGYMAVVGDLHKPACEWTAGGCPMFLMMNIERRHGEDKPVIKKYLVDMTTNPFTTFESSREQWKTQDNYRFPGPIQFSGPHRDFANFTVMTHDYSKVAAESTPETTAAVPVKQVDKTQKIAVALIGRDSPVSTHFVAGLRSSLPVGSVMGSNVDKVLHAAAKSLPAAASVIGNLKNALPEHSTVEVFDGAYGLIHNKRSPLKYGAALRRTRRSELQLLDNVDTIAANCQDLDALVLLAPKSHPLVAALRAKVGDKLKVHFVDTFIGVASVVQSVAHLTGNLLIDDRSAFKYWYFVRVPGGKTSHLALDVANQTHVNGVASPDALGVSTYEEIVAGIAEIVKQRSAAGKNFGTVLIPDSLLLQLDTAGALSQLKVSDAAAFLNGAEDVPSKVTSYLDGLPEYIRTATIKGAARDPVSYLQSVPVERWISNGVAKAVKNEVTAFSPVELSFSPQVDGCQATIADADIAFTVGQEIAAAPGSLDKLAPDTYDEVLSFFQENRAYWAENDVYVNPGPTVCSRD